jgi:protocatechuate 3,4-dioxygenase alpha subunit
VDVSIFARGLLNRLVTRIYFAGQPLNETDPVLQGLADDAARSTLIAQAAAPGVWRRDIVLQGEGETVFFEL